MDNNTQFEYAVMKHIETIAETLNISDENKKIFVQEYKEFAKILKNNNETQLKQEIDKKVAESIKDLPTKDFVRAEINQVRTEVAEVKASLETKIAQSEARLETKLAQSEARLEAKIAKSESTIIKWMIGIGIGTVGALATITKLFLLPS